MVCISIIDLFPHLGKNWAIGSESSVTVRNDKLWNSPFNILHNIFWILCKLAVLAKEIDDSKFCMPCETFLKVVDSLFKLMKLVVNLPNQLQHLLGWRLVHPCVQLCASSLERTTTKATGLPSNVELPSMGYRAQIHSQGTLEWDESWSVKACQEEGPCLWTCSS